MTLKQYQNDAWTTAIPTAKSTQYLVLGLVSEAGEVAGKFKKLERGDYRNSKQLFDEHIAAELGDVLWYLSSLARQLGMDLESIAQYNLAKLRHRQAAGTLAGSGDSR